MLKLTAAAHVLLLLALLLLTIEVGSRRSNEYEAFVKYLANEVTYVNETDVFDRVDSCYSPQSILTGRDDGSLAVCADTALSYISQQYQSFWTPKPKDEHSSAVGAGVDCRYDFIDLGHFTVHKPHPSANVEVIRTSLDDIKLYLEIEFEIHQSDCQSVHHAMMIHGGSSFEVTLESHHHFLSCGIMDKFNGMYVVYCYVPINRSEAKAAVWCSNVTVLLDYEHYAAFYDAKPTNLKLRHEIVRDVRLCRVLPKLLFKGTSSRANPPWSSRSRSTDSTIHMDATAKSLSKGGLTSMADSSSNNISFYRKNSLLLLPLPHYEWVSRDAVFLSRPDLHRCMRSNGHLHLIGPVDMKSNFFQLVYSYLNEHVLAQLSRSHDASIELKGIKYFEVRSLGDVAMMLQSTEITMICRSKVNITVVCLLGRQDFYLSLRNFVRNPRYGPSLVAALQDLKDRGCDQYVRVVWVTTPPELPDANTLWSNNYVIKAGMQWLMGELSALDYQQLAVVDSFELLLPTVSGGRRDVVCGDLYLCLLLDNEQDAMLQTVGGKAVLSAILHSACSNVINATTSFSNSSWTSGSVVKVFESIVRKKTLRKKGIRGMVDPKYVRSHSSELYNLYLLRYGLRRLIPDRDTYDCMHLSVYPSHGGRGMLFLDEVDLVSIPLDAPLPSRRNMHLLRSELGEVFIILNCSRYLLRSIAGLTHALLGYNAPTTVSQVEVVDAFDLWQITLGSELTNGIPVR
jgi:hypothetical protein